MRPLRRRAGHDRAVGIVQRRKRYPVPLGDTANLVDTRRLDSSTASRERLEPLLERERHALQQATMHDERERMPVEHSLQIRLECHTAGDDAESAEEHAPRRRIGVGGKILRISRIAHDGVGRNAGQLQRRSREARCADDDVGPPLGHAACQLHVVARIDELIAERQQPLRVTRDEDDSACRRRQVPRTPRSDIACRADDHHRRLREVAAFRRAHR
jgi:hypothetical protein